MGLVAFTFLFLFGALFALANTLLFIPQPECPLPKGETRPSVRQIGSRMLGNRPLVALAIVQGCYSLANVAYPFFYTYEIRDVGMNMFWISTINAIFLVTSLVASPLWGRAVGRYGYKPILTLGFSIWGPATILWYWVPPGSGLKALWVVALTNVIGAIGMSAVGVSIITALYKVTEPVGRSIQLAYYRVFTTAAGIPMPIIGIHVVDWLKGLGYNMDLRFTFYAMMAFMIACAFLCRRLIDPDSASVWATLKSMLGLSRMQVSSKPPQ
jgi:MFS family permease